MPGARKKVKKRAEGPDPRWLLKGQGAAGDPDLHPYLSVRSYLGLIAGIKAGWMSERFISDAMAWGGLACVRRSTKGHAAEVEKPAVLDWAVQGFPVRQGVTIAQLALWYMEAHGVEYEVARRAVASAVKTLDVPKIRCYQPNRVPESLRSRIVFQPMFRLKDYWGAVSGGVEVDPFGDSDRPTVDPRLLQALPLDVLPEWSVEAQGYIDGEPWTSRFWELIEDGWPIDDPFRLDLSPESFRQLFHAVYAEPTPEYDDSWPDELGPAPWSVAYESNDEGGDGEQEHRPDDQAKNSTL